MFGKLWNREVQRHLERLAGEVVYDVVAPDEIPNNTTTEDPSLLSVDTYSPSPRLTFQERLEQLSLTKYHRFYLHEFEDLDQHRLGKGGQGCVFRRIHPKFGEVAVKRFNENTTAKIKEREMENIAKIQGHPNIIRLFGFLYNKHEKICGYVMEYVAWSMAEVIFEEKEGRRFYQYTVAQAVKWVIEIAAAMSFLHQIKVIHRDLKPNNILVVWDKEGKPIRICDLGCSKDFFLSRGNETKGVGTAFYIPPESMCSRESQEETENRTAFDVFSLAITFWQLLHRPKEPVMKRSEVRRYEMEIEANIAIGMRPAIDSSCPEELAKIIRSCWAQDVKLRPTMKELKEKLAALLAQKEEWQKMVVTWTDETSLEKMCF